MDSHVYREENQVLRKHLEDSQQKMRLLADALEKQNEHTKVWAQRSIVLEEQLKIAQDEINSQASLISERDSTILKLRESLEGFRKEKHITNQTYGEEAKRLHKDLENQHQQFLETLNQLNQSKVPAKQSLELQNQLIMKKELEVTELKHEISRIVEQFEEKCEEINDLKARNKKVSEEKESLRKINEDLLNELREVKTGKKEAEEIENLRIHVSKEQQKVLELIKNKKKHMNAFNNLRQEMDSKNNEITQLKENLLASQEKALEYESRLRAMNSKLDEQKVLLSKSLSREKELSDRIKEQDQKKVDLEKQVKVLSYEKETLHNQSNEKAQSRIKNIQSSDAFKLKFKEQQIRIRQEMEKRLDYEEENLGLKEKIAGLQKEIALLKEQVVDARGADIDPLINLLKDMRVEAIEIDKEYESIISSIPETTPLSIPELPQGLCESITSHIINVNSHFSELQIENRQLRVALNKLIRNASLSLRVSRVIAQYPILSADDIGTQEERGNWVLPIETEHLQRTIIKLHDILIRKK